MWQIPLIAIGTFLLVKMMPAKIENTEPTKENKPNLNFNNARTIAAINIKRNEGFRTTVYKDSLGKNTVGYGHLVLPSDNLKEGDEISEDKVNEFFERDFNIAFSAGVEQALELGKTSTPFIAALAEVNYQLGTKWRNEFKNTWGYLVNNSPENAIDNLLNSKWSQQTPDRVINFIDNITIAYA